MYERMLDKQVTPSFDDLIHYCGAQGDLWRALDEHLESKYAAEKLIRFPYGNHYGWGIKYSHKKKHICDIFAEDNAFTVFLRIHSNAFDSISKDLTDYAKEAWDNRYPCGMGGWIQYRVLSCEHLDDIEKILSVKVNLTK